MRDWGLLTVFDCPDTSARTKVKHTARIVDRGEPKTSLQQDLGYGVLKI
jgi:hypothetical protein